MDHDLYLKSIDPWGKSSNQKHDINKCMTVSFQTAQQNPTHLPRNDDDEMHQATFTENHVHAPHDITLRIRVTPNAKNTALLPGLHTDTHGISWLKIALAAKPQDNTANKALVHFLAQKLKHPKSRIQIISGMHDRHKRLLLTQPSDTTRTYIYGLHPSNATPEV